jgi:hypothetical protein
MPASMLRMSRRTVELYLMFMLYQRLFLVLHIPSSACQIGPFVFAKESAFAVCRRLMYSAFCLDKTQNTEP